MASGEQSNTPLQQTISDLGRLTTGNIRDYYEGKELHFGADAARAAWDLIPYKLPGVKLIIEREIMDRILEQSDPAAYQRKINAQRKWEREQGQGYWWGTGQ